MPDLSQRVIQIPADPRSIAESDVLSEALAEGRPAVASFIYEREDGREMIVIVFGAAERSTPTHPLTPAPVPALPVLTLDRALIGALSLALVLVWILIQR